MGAEYTPEQRAAVVRVMKLKITDYYGILMVERTCTMVEVKKAYRKLAVVVHPDKNKAPEADEAFKRVSKSFQVLSDETKRKIYDQTGGDPDSRAAGYGPGPGAGASPFGASPFGGQRSQRSQFAGGDDIFNMFFGGAGPQPQFQFHFGSPQGNAFGGGPDIFSALFGDAFGMPNRAGAQQRQAQREPSTESHVWMNLLIVVALILISPLASWLTGSADSLPKFRFDAASPYTQEVLTTKYHIPFYVNPKDVSDLSARKQRQLQREAENQFVARTRAACSAEYLDRQERMQAATGWFSVDEEKYEAAKNMPLPHCDLLNSFGIRLQQ